MAKEKKIVPLYGSHLPLGETPEGVVKLLESLVTKAKRGELLGLCAAWVEGNNDVSFHIANGAAPSSILVAAVTALDFEMKYRWAHK